MSVGLIGFLTLALGIIMLSTRIERTFQILIFSILFQAAAAAQLGNVNIITPFLLLAFTAVSLFFKSRLIGEFQEAILFPRAGFWLTLFTLWCGISAFFLPRLFAGEIEVYPVVSNLGATIALHPETLSYSNGNITQFIYQCGSLFLFLCIYTFALDSKRAFLICNSIIMFSIGNVTFAFVDSIGSFIGHPELLDVIHNAGYVMHTDEAVAGLHRISGSFPETSTFSFYTLGGFAFTSLLCLNGYRPILTSLLAACQAALLLASTSTTAYVGISIVVIYILSVCVLKMLNGKANRMQSKFLLLTPMIAVILTMALLLDGNSRESIAGMLNAVIFDKGTTDSALERGALNAQAFETFISTYGLGAGLGSVRASSFVLALMATVGVPGAIIYGGFLAKIFHKRSCPLDKASKALCESARAGVFASLVAATISGALVDMGLLFATFAALACASTENRELVRQNKDANLRTQGLVFTVRVP